MHRQADRDETIFKKTLRVMRLTGKSLLWGGAINPPGINRDVKGGHDAGQAAGREVEILQSR